MGINKKPPFDANKPWLSTYRSIRSLIPMILWTAITAYAAYLWAVLTPPIRIPDFVPYIGGFRLGMLWFLPVSLALETIRRYYNDLWVFDSHRVTHHAGRLSLKYNVPVIKYIHIRAITVSQSILGRILNYGDIYLGTAGEDGNELIVRGVTSPRKLSHHIDMLRLDLERNQVQKSPVSESPAQELPRYGTYDE